MNASVVASPLLSEDLILKDKLVKSNQVFTFQDINAATQSVDNCTAAEENVRQDPLKQLDLSPATVLPMPA